MKESFSLKISEKECKEIGLLIQMILLVFVIYFIILTMIESSFMVLIEIFVSLVLFVMAYNNEKIYKRKGLTYAYIIMGIIMIISGIFRLM